MTKKFVFSTLIIFCLFLFVLPTFAENYGLDTAVAETTLSKTPLTTIIGNGIATVLSFLGIVFFGLLIYAGFNWMTARGNAEKSSKALGTIIDSLIGIIIILSAYVATQFIFSNLKPDGSSDVNKTVNSCASTKGDKWSCKIISSCGLELATDDIDELRTGCEANPDKCALNLCSGGLENVCCISDTVLGPPVPEPETITKCFKDCTASTFNSCITITAIDELDLATKALEKDCKGKNITDGDCPSPCGGTKKVIGDSCAEETDCVDELTCLTKHNAFDKSCEAVCSTDTDCPTGYTTCSFNTSAEGSKYCMQ